MTSADRITPEEKAAFEERGFHVLRNALTEEEVEAYRDAMRKVFLVPEDHPYSASLTSNPIPGVAPPPDNPRSLWNGFDLPAFDDRFFDLIYHPKIALTMDALIGPDINFYETCFVTKLPHFPGHFRDWHQDSSYFDPMTNDRNAAVIVYLDDMDSTSGATSVVPGSHKHGTLPHVTPAEDVSSKHQEVADKRTYDASAVTFDFKAGDALFFLCRVIHKAGGNSTDMPRTGLIYNYMRRDCLDLGQKNRSLANSIPVTRNGRLYLPGRC
jgi:ectoine hydroxylase-related dioxygenase (phytanoyl-CoA dioxygenase family)